MGAHGHIDLLRELRYLALASRLKRLSERLMHDVSRTYRERDTNFEARWFPIAYQLSLRSKVSVTELAEALGYTHPAVVQIVGAMEKQGLVRSGSDRSDGRRRLLTLTRQGRDTVKRLQPTWEAVRTCTEGLIAETAPEFLSQMTVIEDALDSRSMYKRLRTRLGHETVPVELIPYRPALARKFAELNREWLGPVLPIEPHDQDQLEHPDREILQSGGQILFARVGRSIVGTAAVICHRAGIYEIAKMAVTEKKRRKGIGRRLAQAAIDWARAQGANEIRIATSPKLDAALSLYRSMGFAETSPNPAWRGQYNRPTVFMKLEKL